MPIKVLTAAASYDLTTVARVGDELALTSAEVTNNNTLLVRLISRASDAVRTMTERTFAKEEVEETVFVRRASPRLVVSRTPIVSITSIALDGNAVDASTYFVENPESGFIYRKDGFWDSTAIRGGHIVERATQWGQYDWKVTYTGGYELPSNSNNPTFPLDLERAVIEMVGAWFYSRQTNPSIASESIGDAKVTYRDSGPGGVPDTARMTIDRWRRLD